MAGKNYYDGGEAVVQAFRSLGVDYVMSSPGSEWGSVWEAFARQTVSNTQGPVYFSCAHETLAVNVAMGYALYTERMQAVMLHTGVGLLQGSMGIESAYKQNIPLVIVSGESLTYGTKEGFNPGGQWQAVLSVVGGPQRFAEPITKWATQASSVHTLYNQLVSAGGLAQRAPAGPTFLTVPIETQLAEWPRPAELSDVPPAPSQVPLADDIARAAALLIAAENPLIVTQSAGRQPAAREALIALAEAASVPVVESRWADYANFPKDHPLYQGPATRELLDEADLVLIVRSGAPWYPPHKQPAKARHIVAIDVAPFNPAMTYHNVPADLFLEGDIAASLRLLTESVREAGPDKQRVTVRRDRWAATHDKFAAEGEAIVEAAREKGVMDPAFVCATIGEACPDDAIFVDETITYKGAILRHLPYGAPQSYFRSQGGLGQGLGLALGVKLAARNRPVVAIMGDGTFMYNPIIQSLSLARKEELPILIVVLNNGGYDAMRKEHHAFYPEGTAAEHDLFYGFPVTDLEYQELVAPFGGHGARVETPAELAPAIVEAMKAVASGKTAILNVLTATTTGHPGG